MRIKLLISMVALALVAIAIPAGAAGNGNGLARKQAREATATCTVDGNHVSATGLPSGEPLNFMIVDPEGVVSGWALGKTYEGWWELDVPERSGDTTYMFTGATKGKNGKNYDVFASCSAGI